MGNVVWSCLKCVFCMADAKCAFFLLHRRVDQSHLPTSMSLAWRTSSNLTEGRWGPTWIKGGINLLEKARWDQANQVQVWHLSIRYGYNGYNPIITTQIASTRSFTSPSPWQDRIMGGWRIQQCTVDPNPSPSDRSCEPRVQHTTIEPGIAPAFWVILGESLWISSLLVTTIRVISCYFAVQPLFSPSIHRTMEQ